MTEVRRGWLHLASGAGIGRIFGFVSNLLLSRWLGPVDLGLFNLVTTTVQTSDTLVRCGGDYALNYQLGGQPQAIRTARGAQLARALAQLCSLTTIVFCIAFAIWAWWGQGIFPISITGVKRLNLTLLLVLMIACEGSSASAWEILLVSHRTRSLALRQGLFYPLRLLSAATGALFHGVFVAMLGWTAIAVLQCFWLKRSLGELWKPLHIWPLLSNSLLQLLRTGLPFYAANLLASMIFYPLLLKLASGSGLADIGYLRVGQVLQQLFAFLPATLVPVLFLKLRGESSFANQVLTLEMPFRICWFLLLEVLLLYCTFDQAIIQFLFGDEFASAYIPTRILLITALIECLSQLLVQPLLADGKTRVYGFWQNGAAISSAFVGWLWIPTSGIAAYLIARLLYVIIPFVGFGLPVVHLLQKPHSLITLSLTSITLLMITLVQCFNDYSLQYSPYIYSVAFLVVGLSHLHDVSVIPHLLRRKN